MNFGGTIGINIQIMKGFTTYVFRERNLTSFPEIFSVFQAILLLGFVTVVTNAISFPAENYQFCPEQINEMDFLPRILRFRRSPDGGRWIFRANVGGAGGSSKLEYL